MLASSFPPLPLSTDRGVVLSSVRLLVVRFLAILLVALVCLPAGCLSISSRQQHNVWYNGLFISGIAVDESSGDVFFSDAAANRVVRQSANGTLLAEYRSSFYSPMQLAWYDGSVYVADSNNNRVAVIDVAHGGQISASPSPPDLSSCSALAVDNVTGYVYVLDGWGLGSQELTRDAKKPWDGYIDLSAKRDGYVPPHYLASATVYQSDKHDLTVWLLDPTQPTAYHLEYPYLDVGWEELGADALGRMAVQHYWSDNDTAGELYMLGQTAADQPMQITLMDITTATTISNWTAKGRGGAAIPFYGWAMHVDSQRNMYISDHGVDEDSPYGRVVKIAPNGTELGQWSMSDGTAYSPSSIWYDDDPTAGGSCAYWMTDSERGVVRVGPDGSVLLPFIEPPIDPADGLTARFTVMVEDVFAVDHINYSLVLLDTASSVTTKVWRLALDNLTYTLLNTSEARLGPNITGAALNLESEIIYLCDTRTHSVVAIYYTGGWYDSFNTSWVGLVEPAGLLATQYIDLELIVVDSAFNDTTGAIVRFNESHRYVFTDTSPPMYRPISLTLDQVNNQLYVADEHGYIFQIDVNNEQWVQQAAHQPLPIASHITSMTISARGNLYMVDAYSRRLIILMWAPASWDLGSPCLPPMSSSSSSSSSSSTAASSVTVVHIVDVVVVELVDSLVAARGSVAVVCCGSGGRDSVWRRGSCCRSRLLLYEVEEEPAGSADKEQRSGRAADSGTRAEGRGGRRRRWRNGRAGQGRLTATSAGCCSSLRCP